MEPRGGALWCAILATKPAAPLGRASIFGGTEFETLPGVVQAGATTWFAGWISSTERGQYLTRDGGNTWDRLTRRLMVGGFGIRSGGEFERECRGGVAVQRYLGQQWVRADGVGVADQR